jgi:type IV pilus assembly protein PilV
MTYRNQLGASLIEVLVSVLIIALGVVAVSSMQIKTLQASGSSYQRSQAAMLSYYIVDSMKVDNAAAKALAYNTGAGEIDSTDDLDPICSSSDITATGLAGTNMTSWLGEIKESLGSGDESCGAVICDDQGQCRVQIYWDDSHAGGSTRQSIQVVSKL